MTIIDREETTFFDQVGENKKLISNQTSSVSFRRLIFDGAEWTEKKGSQRAENHTLVQDSFPNCVWSNLTQRK